MLLSKDEDIKTSVVYVGSLILKQLKKNDQVTIFDVAKNLKTYHIVSYRQIVFALMFLYSCGIIDFKEPYIYKL